ncbi:nucleoredoxin-like isoform X1 [Physeter macrocephalus]|uniref:Nucleoredoxin-like isoform X1 n=1 Tax=Physeter macrocephalus TaxID=9755 RepID=A0A455CB49_PHYMC|nr:nucleoredoxin-like isoform X1 [Physeter catodon]|eukprot:XP_028355811.1 nucleoredoxin-like isoform X1 [Physeter catodon]
MSGFLEELLGEKLVTGGGEEVDVHSLAARGISLLGLYFGCSLSAPCAQLSVSLAAFYGRLRGDAAAGPGAGAGPGPGAGAAAEPESRRRLEIVFVSSDQDQRQWQDFVRDMPWLALPYKEKHRKVQIDRKNKDWGKFIPRCQLLISRRPRPPPRRLLLKLAWIFECVCWMKMSVVIKRIQEILP